MRQLIAALGAFALSSPSVAATIVTYEFSSGTTQPWPGGPPPGWPGSNPGPTHDQQTIIEIPKFYVEGTVISNILFGVTIEGSASHPGFAVSQLYTYGGTRSAPEFPGGVFHEGASNGFIRQAVSNFLDGHVNYAGTGDFCCGFGNVSGLVGTAPGQFATAVIPVAARLRPPSSESYSTTASVRSTWTIGYEFNGDVTDPYDDISRFVRSGAQKEVHRANALQAKTNAATVNLAAAVWGGLGNLGGSINDVINEAISAVSGAAEKQGNWGEVVSIAITAIAASISISVAGGTLALSAAPAALALATSILFYGTYWSVVASVETKLANDPPDYNYSVVKQHSPSGPLGDLGLGEALQAQFQSDFDTFEKSVQARQNLLTSLERGQGAFLSGNNNLAWFQGQAIERYEGDLARLMAESEGKLDALPGRLQKFEKDLPAIKDAYAVFGASPPPSSAVPEPASWAMLIGGFGFVGGALRRSRQGRTAVSYG